jgi:hypothetical protein
MTNNQNETSRTRRTLGGGTKTVTKSKSVDAAGTKTKTRTVSRSIPSASGVTDVKKQVTRKKFEDGSTSKQKKETVYRAKSGVDKMTTVKEKTSKPGLVNKVKSLVQGANKYAYSGNNVSSAKQTGYSTGKKVQDFVKKGRNII